MRVPYLKILVEEPADFLNPYWYEQLGGINWSEEGHPLVMYDKLGPVWNPEFPSSLFLNHGVHRIHIVLSTPGFHPPEEAWVHFVVDVLPHRDLVFAVGENFCQPLELMEGKLAKLFRERSMAIFSVNTQSAKKFEEFFDPRNPSFTRLQEFLRICHWVLLPEGGGISIYSYEKFGKDALDRICQKAREIHWPVYWVKNLFDFTFSNHAVFQQNGQLPTNIGVEQLA